MSTESLESRVKQWALEGGFDAAGLAPAEEPATLLYYDRQIQNQLPKDLGYLVEHRDLKASPQLLLAQAQSWIVLITAYDTQEDLSIDSMDCPPPHYGWIARYARGRDYHKVLHKKLNAFTDLLRRQFPSEQFRSFVDSAPVLEKDLAVRAGLGWMGKNTCVIDEKRGSFFFVSEILTTLSLHPDMPPVDRCGTCTKCIDVCPTQALQPYQLNAGKCISYWTIESKSEPPPELQTKMGAHLFGCDLCQDVCPWNQKARRQNALPDAQESGWVPLQEIIKMPDEVLSAEIAGTPLNRSGAVKLKARARQILEL